MEQVAKNWAKSTRSGNAKNVVEDLRAVKNAGMNEI
jgi:hypothetical protein